MVDTQGTDYRDPVMNLIDFYLSTSRIALQAECTDPTTWQEMHSVLPHLHEHLSCRLCHKLVDELNPYSEGFVCTTCGEYETKKGMWSSVLLCYKKLCVYIKNSPIYNVMCTRAEDNRLVEILNEVVGMSCSINGHNSWVNGTGNKKQIKKEKLIDYNNIESNSSVNVQSNVELKTSEEYGKVQVLDVQNQSNLKFQKRKRDDRRWGCRCGKTTSTTGKLTCIGQRCPCYTEQKPCDRCKCRGCRNPRQKKSNDDDNLEIDKIRRKPVTLELVSSLKPPHVKNKSGFITKHELLQFPSHSQHYDQGGAEITLGHVNSIFHSS